MTERSFDEMIAYFNRRLADMDINQDYKMELLGMVTALGFKHEKSVQPERKTGKWLVQDNPGTGWYRVTCSECGEDVTANIPLIGFFPNCKPLWDFCPYCGADMRGTDE